MSARETIDRLKAVGIRRESPFGNPYWVIPEREMDSVESEVADDSR